MSVDFAALVHAVVAGVADVRACLMVSRDGLALGAFPAEEEEKALAAWSQIAALGETDRGFVGFRDEMWVFCRRGPYAALARASSSARAGLILDRLEEMLLVAEEARMKKEAFRSAMDRDASPLETPRGPRTSLHRELREEASPRPAPLAPPEEAADLAPAVIGESSMPVDAEPAEGSVAPSEETPPGDEGSWMVDTMALRREFAGILMPPEKQDEES